MSCVKYILRYLQQTFKSVLSGSFSDIWKRFCLLSPASLPPVTTFNRSYLMYCHNRDRSNKTSCSDVIMPLLKGKCENTSSHNTQLVLNKIIWTLSKNITVFQTFISFIFSLVCKCVQSWTPKSNHVLCRWKLARRKSFHHVS